MTQDLSMSFDLNDWYREFLTWMRTERGPEVLEILSDFSDEQYLNALMALHLRRYGRVRGFELFWARGEWAKVDICFGQAPARFADWNAAWNQHATGDLGQIEGKLLYWHYANSKHLEYLNTLRGQLENRRGRDQGHRTGQFYLGFVWLFVHEPSGLSDDALEAFRSQVSGHTEWDETLKDTGLVVRPMDVERPDGAVFDRITTLDLRTVWPLESLGTASLWVTCLETMPERASGR